MLDLLQPIRKKLFLKTFFTVLGKFTFVALCLSSLILLLSRFLPIIYYREFLIFIISLSVLSGTVYGIIKKPSFYLAAREADKYDLEERAVTALNFQNSHSTIAKLQQEDTIRLLQKRLPFILAKISIWPFTKKQIYTYLGTFLVFLVLTVIPNLTDDYIAEQKIVKQQKEQIAAKLIKEEETIKNNKNLTAIQKEELLEAVNRLKKEIAATKSTEEQLKLLEKMNKELANLEAKQKLSQANYNHLKKLNHNLKNLSAEEKEALLNALKAIQQSYQELAKELNSDQAAQITNSLQNAVEAMQNGQYNNFYTSLNNAMQMAMTNSQQAQQMAQQLLSTLTALQQSQMMLANANNNQFNQGSNHTAGMQSSGDSTGSQSNGTDDANGINNNSNQNQGNGTGNVNEGNGGNGTNGNGTNQNGVNGNGAGLGNGSHLINIPSERINSEGISETVGGPLGNGESQINMANNGNIAPGLSLSYEKVYNDYAQFARESIENNQIPTDYQEIIKAYFSSIEP